MLPGSALPGQYIPAPGSYVPAPGTIIPGNPTSAGSVILSNTLPEHKVELPRK